MWRAGSGRNGYSVGQAAVTLPRVAHAMNFLNPLAALIAAGVAVPALLALYFLKLRRQERPVSSTILWRKAVQDLQVNAPFQKLRKNLLLLLQLLALAALLLALARPVSAGRPTAGESTVILIDRSASMNAPDGGEPGSTVTRLEAAKRRAKELVDTMGRGDRAMVVSFSDAADTRQAFTADAAALRRAIDAIGPSDRPTRLADAFKLADAQLQFDVDQLRPDAQNDVFLYSDGVVADSAELSLRGRLHYEPVGRADTANVALVALSAKRNYERPTEVQVFARLANYGPEPVNAAVRLSVAEVSATAGGAAPAAADFVVRDTSASVDLPPSRWTDEERAAAETGGFVARDSVEFTLELTTAAVIRVQQMRGGDGLPADDAAEVVVPPPEPLSVLLVTDGNPYLERLVLGALDLRDPKVVTPAQYDAAVPDTYDVIVFDRHSPEKLPPAGNFVYFGGVARGLKLKQATDAGQPLFTEGNLVLDWDRDHPILRGLNLSKLYARTAMRLDVPLEAKAIVEGLKGPLVVLYREGRRRHLVVAFDTLESNWPLRQSFPYFMYNALQFMAAGEDMDLRQSYQPGEAVRIPRLNLQRIGRDGTQAAGDTAGREAVRSIRLDGPTGRRAIEVPADGEFVIPQDATERVGLYGTEPPVPQFEHFAVNLLDAAESDLTPRPKDRPPGDLQSGGGNPAGGTASADAGRQVEWWWWLVAAVGLPLLMVEWFVYTRRVHL